LCTVAKSSALGMRSTGRRITFGARSRQLYCKGAAYAFIQGFIRIIICCWCSHIGGTTTRSTKPVAASITDKHFFSLLTISASSLTLLHFLLHHGFDAILVMLSPLVISFVATVTKCDPSKTKFATFCPFSDISMYVLIASSSLQPTIAASFARCPR